MTRGEQLVGIDFNVDNRGDVHKCKMRFAHAINQLEELRHGPTVLNATQELLLEEAITRIVDAQMWAVKAITAK